ncbi:MAG TPA: serine hydrolase domain-containing protein [Candidatus Dormibacteraeota bacterium]|nr:serine hydrolase domain-containing protein [Candidatus Dormibacteraeota bacterium]
MGDPLTESGLARLGELASAHVGDDDVPGLVALVSCRDQVHVEARGSLTIGGPPARRDSLFRISSTSKVVTGAATLALVDEGLLRLDQPVGDLLPELAGPRVLRSMGGSLDDTVEADREITVRDLLTFTNGFGMSVDMFMAEAPWPVVTAANGLRLGTLGPPDPAVQPDPDTWIAGLGSLPLMAQPGVRWLYGTGASILGVLLARAARMPLADVLRTRLFEPLGMRDTAFWTRDVERLATAYAAARDGLRVWDEPGGKWSREPDFGDGGDGLLSTVDDLNAFARMFLRGGSPVLSAGAVEGMTHDQLTAEQRQGGAAFLSGQTWGFCQSVIVTGRSAGAFGWDGGLGTSWLVDPRRDLAIVVLTQKLFGSAGAPRVHVDIQAAAYAALA